MVKLAKKLVGLQYDIIYQLAIHLNSTYELVFNNKEIVNKNLEIIKSKYEIEFKVARSMKNN